VLSPQQAWSSIAAHVSPLPAHACALDRALGHVLADAVRADRDSPAADRSAMDGYAVRAADLGTVPVTLTAIGEIAAGSPAKPQVVARTCARIFTGANVPPGADTVVRVEDTRVEGADGVAFLCPVQSGANILRQGENAHRGDVIVPEQTLLSAAHLSACASAGYGEVRVRRKPTVAVLTTGRELIAPGMDVQAHQERDSNQILIVASLLEAGFQLGSVDRVSDERAAVTERLRAALVKADAVVLSGGVSVGAYDFVPAAVTDVGARTLVHGVSMKPGKPFLFALTNDGRPIFGLPGNPLSAAVGLHEFVLPALRKLAGVAEDRCRPLLRAPLRESLANKPGRERHVLASLVSSMSGLAVSIVPSQSSADVMAGARADGAIVVPADAHTLEPGTIVDFRPWHRWP
jgi:molybdopterin molybdotransferase